MSDPTALAQLLNEGLSQADVWSEEGYYNREKLAAWLAARGVRVLPSELEEQHRQLCELVVAARSYLNSQVYVGVTEEEKRAAYQRLTTLMGPVEMTFAVQAVAAAPRPEEP